MIDAAERAWRKEGKKTRRNWWEILAGDERGKPRRVRGIAFPVIDAIRTRRLYSRPGTSATVKPVAAKRAKAHPAPPRITRQAKPFVKWAGGKRQLLPAILDRITGPYRTYHEPFLGGGAVFFALSPKQTFKNAFLSDSNLRLVRSYQGIRNDVGKVVNLLKSYKKSRAFFLEMRERDIDSATDAEVAAWFIFLNKTGFNGLYRVNSKNKFNVPYGDNRNPEICDENNLRACSRALSNAEITCEGFEAVVGRAKAGDLVYFDPPYVPLSNTSYFTSYTAKGFTRDDQIRLRNIALELKAKDVTVLLSNSSTASELYGDGFEVTEVLAARAVNSKAERRGKITELLIS
jgi:DNA adenine methylase